MIETLIILLVLALVFYIVYWAMGNFVQGRPLQIIGLILALAFLLIALRRFGVFGELDL